MIKHFFSAITGNVVSLIGTLMIVTSLLLIGALLMMQAFGYEGGAYVGILTFVLMPMFFLMGIALVPIGLWWRKRRDAKLAATGQDVGHLPVIDLNKEGTRGVLLGFVALAIPTLALAAGLTFKAVHYMDSDEFCGMACHKVMEPEYTAFQRSPHARVGCAGCHIGAGCRVVRQGEDLRVLAARRGRVRPVSAPDPDAGALAATVERHLRAVPLADEVPRRPAQGPHALRRGRGQHRAQDGADGQGRRQGGGPVAGHPLARRSRTTGSAIAPIPTREIMYEVELTDLAEGTTKVFKGEEPAPEGAEWRTMDCVDCHNRASHIYRSPEFELDLALEEGRIDRSLPYIRRRACASSPRRNTTRTPRRARASRPRCRRSMRRTIPTSPARRRSSRPARRWATPMRGTTSRT